MIAWLARRHLAHPDPTALVLLAGASLVGLVSVGGAAPVLAIFLLALRRSILRRDLRFEAALPIRGREIVIARALAILVLLCLPASIWAGAALLRDPAPATLGTVLQIAALAALGVAAIFVALWYAVPDALQLSPGRESRGAAAAATPSDARHAGVHWRWATARSLLSATVVTIYLLAIATAAIGSSFIFFCLAILIVSGVVRPRTRWLAALPLTHRARLLAIVVPAVVVPAGCVALGAMIHASPLSPFHHRASPAPATPSIWLVNAAALVTFGLATLLLAETGHSHRRRPGSRMPAMAPWLAVLPLFAFVVADTMLDMRDGGSLMPLVQVTVRRLASALPANVGVVALVAAVPVAAAYALLERQFRHSELGTAGRAAGR